MNVSEHQRRRPDRRNRDAETRIKALTGEKYALQRERDQLAAERDALFRALEAQHRPPAGETVEVSTSPAARPKLEAFDSHETWVEALTDWKADQRAQQTKDELKAELRAEQAAERQRTLAQSWDERMAEAATHYDDFAEAVNNPAVQFRNDLLPVVHEVIGQSPQGYVLLHALATDDELRAALDERTPVAAKAFLQKTLAQLLLPTPPMTPRPRTPTPTTRQPIPTVTPVLGNGASAPIRHNASTIAQQRGSLTDYMRARESETHRP